MFNCGTNVSCVEREARETAKRIIEELYMVRRANRTISDVWTLIGVHSGISARSVQKFVASGDETIRGLDILNYRYSIRKKDMEDRVYRILLAMARFFLKRKAERVIFVLDLFAFVMTIAGICLIFTYAI